MVGDSQRVCALKRRSSLARYIAFSRFVRLANAAGVLSHICKNTHKNAYMCICVYAICVCTYACVFVYAPPPAQSRADNLLQSQMRKT